MKTKKSVKKEKKSKRRMLAAFGMAALLITSGVFALPLLNPQDSLAKSVRSIQQDPQSFINAENIALEKDFDYFREMNKEFADFDPEDLDSDFTEMKGGLEE